MGSGLALQYVTHYGAFQAATLEKCVITRSDPFTSPQNDTHERPRHQVYECHVGRFSQRICLGSSAWALLHLTYRCRVTPFTEIIVLRASARASRRPCLPPD